MKFGRIFLLLTLLSSLSLICSLNIRRNILSLTPSEFDDFASAILKLKFTPYENVSPPFSLYDEFVVLHDAYQFAAHRGPAFLPWHRTFLSKFERLLQQSSGNPNLTVPYWNWMDEKTRMLPFTNKMMGSNGSVNTQHVDDGAFSSKLWTHVVVNGAILYEPLTRCFSCHVPYMPSMPWMNRTTPSLPSVSDVTDALTVSLYDSPPFNETSKGSFRNTMEGWQHHNCALHNAVHIWFGGIMRQVPVSPNDPTFWIHHATVDKIYGIWQSLYYPNDTFGGYVPLSGARRGQNYFDMMEPFNTTVAFGVHRANFNYEYEQEDSFDGAILREIERREMKVQ